MKSCPVCDAEYDDHVEYCFVDGAELVVQPTNEAPLPPPPGSPAGRLIPIMLVLAAIAMLAMVAVVVVLGMTWMGQGDEIPNDDGIVPSTERIGLPPEPEAPAAESARVEVRSVPSGAEVWEGNSQLCPATPCTVEHPDHAPIPRRFEIRLEGYRTEAVDLTDIEQPVQARLRRRRAERAPRPARVRPDPAPPAPNADAQPILPDR